ncbi:MAG: AMP-binding protein [Acidobacteria bacterium]|nr:AMP-binding protein [Acidobacteriota bacterium]
MNSNIGSYEETYKKFSWSVPEYFNFAFDVVDEWAKDPNRLAMLWVGENREIKKLSYQYFQTRANQVANVLESLGLRKGDRVLLLMARIPAWWELVLGMIKLGVVFLPATTQLTSKDIIYRIEASNASVVITDEENATKFDVIRDKTPQVKHFILVGEKWENWHSYNDLIEKASLDFNPKEKTKKDDPLLLYFTSGTTGYPKMVLHTHSSYPIGHKITGYYWLDLKTEDLHWNLSDTGWAKAAWSSLFGPWNTGSTLFVHNGKGKFDAQLTLELLSEHKITSFCAPPTAYRMLVGLDLTQYNLEKLRSCVSAGEPLNPEIIDIWEEKTGLVIREGYGQTETCLLVGTFPEMLVKKGSMGKSAPGFIVDIIDENGNIASDHHEGDIGVRTNPIRPVGIFQEYWEDTQATANSIRGDWYITGDKGFRDKDGYLWFVGRADDVIISAGYRIGPFEVESALIEHPNVLEAAVVGKADNARGQIVKAYVILKPGVEKTEALSHALQDFVKQITAPYKYPREIEFVDELPKTISGKIRRVELRERANKLSI